MSNRFHRELIEATAGRKNARKVGEGASVVVPALKKLRSEVKFASALGRAEHGTPILHRKNGTLGEILFTVPIEQLTSRFGPDRDEEVKNFQFALSLYMLGRRLDQVAARKFQEKLLAKYRLAVDLSNGVKFPDREEVLANFERIVLHIDRQTTKLSPKIKEEISKALTELEEERDRPLLKEPTSLSMKKIMFLLALCSLELYVQNVILQKPDSIDVSNIEKINNLQGTFESAGIDLGFITGALLGWKTGDAEGVSINKIIRTTLLGTAGGAIGYLAGQQLGSWYTRDIPLHEVVPIGHTMEHITAAIPFIFVILFIGWLHQLGINKRNDIYNKNSYHLKWRLSSIESEISDDLAKRKKK